MRPDGHRSGEPRTDRTPNGVTRGRRDGTDQLGLVTIYFRLVHARIRSQLQYRTSFALYLLGSFWITFIEFAGVLIIFQYLPALGGWSLGEVAFLYGTSYVTFKLTDMAVGHLDGLPVMIQQGDFDMLLIRPLGALFQVLTADFQLRHLGGFIQGLVVLALAMRWTDIEWTAGRALALALMPVSGMLIFASVWVIGHTTAFWTTRSGEFVNAFTYGGYQMTSYPLHIYERWFRRLFAFVVPLAFVNFYPSLYILGKPDPLGAPAVLRFLSPLVAVAVAAVAWLIWNTGVRHYRSTGS